MKRQRKLRLATWLLAALAAFAGPAPAEDQPSGDMEALVGRLRSLVAEAGWETSSTPLDKQRFFGSHGDIPAAEWEEHVRSVEDGHQLTAVCGVPRALVFLAAVRFVDEKAARGDLVMRRRQVSALEATESVKLEVRDGAGPDGGLPGLRISFQPGQDDKQLPYSMHVLCRGRVVVALVQAGARALDEEAENAAMARWDAWLTDPKAASALPPLPRPALPTEGTRELRVRVLDPEGRPVAKAQVVATMEGGGFAPRRVIRMCEGDACTLRVPDGGGSVDALHARDRNGRALALPEDVGYTPESSEVVLRLEPAQAIRGRAQESDGSPVVGLVIRAQPPLKTYRAPFHAEATTGADGRFELEGLRDEEYDLEVERDGKPATAVEYRVPAGKSDVLITLGAVQTVRLVVVDGQGKPIAAVRVVASRYARGQVEEASAVTSEDGTCELEALDPTKAYDLSLEPLFDSTPATRRELSRWHPRDETIELAAGWTLRLLAVDDTGAPTRALIRTVGDVGARGLPFTKDDGTFTLSGLPMGAVNVAALRDGLGAISADKSTIRWTRVEPTDDVVQLTVQTPGPQPQRESPRQPPIAWSAPEGWVDAETRFLEAFAFLVGEEDEVVCMARWFPGIQTGEELGFAIWSKDMDMDPPDATRLETLPRVDVLGASCRLLTLEGAYEQTLEDPIEGALLLGVALPWGSGTLMIHIVGPRAKVEPERSRFLELLKSLRPR